MKLLSSVKKSLSAIALAGAIASGCARDSPSGNWGQGPNPSPRDTIMYPCSIVQGNDTLYRGIELTLQYHPTAPAAPAGVTNVLWQDVSENTCGEIAGNVSGLAIGLNVKHEITSFSGDSAAAAQYTALMGGNSLVDNRIYPYFAAAGNAQGSWLWNKANSAQFVQVWLGTSQSGQGFVQNAMRDGVLEERINVFGTVASSLDNAGGRIMLPGYVAISDNVLLVACEDKIQPKCEPVAGTGGSLAASNWNQIKAYFR